MGNNLTVLRLLVAMYENLGDTAMVKVTKATINATIATIAWGE